MSNIAAIQVHCPHCNAVQVPQDGGNYTCDCCLQPFSIVQAQKEESRLLEEIRGWLDKRIGSAGTSPGGIDASSRSYIFQQRLLPDLRRDVDRALEVVGSFGQFQLVPVPVPTPQHVGLGSNPLVANRLEILALKSLRARLRSEYVQSFAVGAEDQAAVQSLDRRLAEIMGLSNVAEAANRRDPIGYATARRNLESVLVEIGESLVIETSSDPTFRPYLAALQNRYRSLVELCRLCEEITSSNAVDGASLSERASQLSESLKQSAREIETSGYSPIDAMPMVISANSEATSAEYLGRWLRLYDVLAAKSLDSFDQLMTALSQINRGGAQPAEILTEIAESYALFVRTARGEIPVPLDQDQSWIPGWAESARARKSLGLFGVDETTSRIDQFLLPAWVADVSFSKATGKVFKEGVEGKCVALVDATAPSPTRVHFVFDGTSSLAQTLGKPQPLSRRDLALPSSTAGMAQLAVSKACSERPEMLQAQVRIRGIAYLSAACAHYVSKNGSRRLAACVGGNVAVDPDIVNYIQAANQVLRLFA